jgi:hypothetical protein
MKQPLARLKKKLESKRAERQKEDALLKLEICDLRVTRLLGGTREERLEARST